MKRAGYEFQRSSLSWQVLALGWIAYLFSCWPLLTSGGYNPGPFWDIMPLLWPAPLIISGLLNLAVAKRRYQVVGYSLGCGLVAGALPQMTPSFFSLSQTMLAWLIYGPLFIMIGILIEMLTAAGMWMLRIPAPSPARHATRAPGPDMADPQTPPMVVPTVTPIVTIDTENKTADSAQPDSASPPPPKLALRRRLAAAAIVMCVAIAAPSLNYIAAVMELPAEARATADRVWQSRNIRRFHAFGGAGRPWRTTPLPSQIVFTEWLEPHTGTKFSMFPTPHWPWNFPGRAAYRATFYAEIARLMRLHGVPAWALKNALIPRRQVIQLLHSNGFTPVRHFPYAIDRHVTIKNGTDVTGRQTAVAGEVWFPSAPGPSNISFKILRRYHSDIAVRFGHSHLVIYSHGGNILYQISPSPQTSPQNGNIRRLSAQSRK